MTFEERQAPWILDLQQIGFVIILDSGCEFLIEYPLLEFVRRKIKEMIEFIILFKCLSLGVVCAVWLQ